MRMTFDYKENEHKMGQHAAKVVNDIAKSMNPTHLNEATARTLPWTVVPLILSPLGGRLGQRLGPALPAAVGLGLVAAGAFEIAALVHPSTTPLALVPGLASLGVGVALVLPNIAALAIGAVESQDIGKASGTLSTARQLGSVFGTAVAVAIFQAGGRVGSLTAATAALMGWVPGSNAQKAEQATPAVTTAPASASKQQPTRVAAAPTVAQSDTHPSLSIAPGCSRPGCTRPFSYRARRPGCGRGGRAW